MWKRLKSLWGGRSVEDAEADADDLSVTEPEPTPPVDPAARSPFARELAAVDGALDAGDVAQALSLARALLDEAPGDRGVLGRAARALTLAGEEELGGVFARASETDAAAPLVEVAAALLDAGDPSAAVAAARGARRRGGAGDADGAIVLAEALARVGDHTAVVETLAAWEGRWVGPGMLQRYALSCVLAGEDARWERVADELRGVEGAGWIDHAAQRAAAYGRPAQSDGGALRECVFVEYGSVLLERAERAAGDALDARALGRLLERAAEVFAAVGLAPTRVGYGSPEGEVVARWLAGLSGGVASPLSGRIPGQRWVVVAVDDEEALSLVEAPEFDHGPTLLFQVIKDPQAAGTPMADLVGVMGHGLALPTEPLADPRAAHRVPPSLLVARLLEEAGHGAGDDVAEDAGMEALVLWARERAGELSAASPVALDERLAYLGDTPRWVRGA